MSKTSLRLACLAALALGVAAQSARDEDYSSQASAIFDRLPAQHSPEAMAAAAREFLATLDDAQLERAHHALTSEERRLWTNLPAASDAGGLRLGDCDAEQLAAASRLLAALFSDQGYRKMVHVLLGDDLLWEREGRRRGGLGVAETSVVIFGEPSASEPWAFQIDGHHVGANLALHGERLSLSPYFIGAQPDVFEVAGRELRPLVREVTYAFELAQSLSAEQRAAALQSEERGAIVSGPGADGVVPEPVGVSCATFDESQKVRLFELIRCWVGDLPAAQAEARMHALVRTRDQLRFAWWGPLEDGAGVSYRIQGPALLIEFSCQGPAADPQDHLHSMYRDPTDEYGGQLGG